MGNLRLADGADLAHLLLFFLSAGCQLLHNFLIHLRVKQLPENHFLIVGTGPQKLHKFSLGDHGHLHKLVFGESHNLLQFGVRLLLGILRAVRHQKRDGFTLLLYPLPPLQGAQMSWHPPYRVFFLLISRSFCESQLHKRLHGGCHILALQLHPVLFVGAGTGLPVEGKDNGVKNGGLSRSRIPGNQKQILAGPSKVDDRPVSVGAKGLHGQLPGSHFALTSCTVLITSRKSSCSSPVVSPRKAQHRSKGSNCFPGSA